MRRREYGLRAGLKQGSSARTTLSTIFDRGTSFLWFSLVFGSELSIDRRPGVKRSQLSLRFTLTHARYVRVAQRRRRNRRSSPRRIRTFVEAPRRLQDWPLPHGTVHSLVFAGGM